MLNRCGTKLCPTNLFLGLHNRERLTIYYGDIIMGLTKDQLTIHKVTKNENHYKLTILLIIYTHMCMQLIGVFY